MKSAAFKTFHVLEERSNFTLLKEAVSQDLSPEWKKFYYLLGTAADQYALLILQALKENYSEFRNEGETLEQFINSNAEGYVTDWARDMREEFSKDVLHAIAANKSKFITEEFDEKAYKDKRFDYFKQQYQQFLAQDTWEGMQQYFAEEEQHGKETFEQFFNRMAFHWVNEHTRDTMIATLPGVMADLIGIAKANGITASSALQTHRFNEGVEFDETKYNKSRFNWFLQQYVEVTAQEIFAGLLDHLDDVHDVNVLNHVAPHWVADSVDNILSDTFEQPIKNRVVELARAKGLSFNLGESRLTEMAKKEPLTLEKEHENLQLLKKRERYFHDRVYALHKDMEEDWLKIHPTENPSQIKYVQEENKTAVQKEWVQLFHKEMAELAGLNTPGEVPSRVYNSLYQYLYVWKKWPSFKEYWSLLGDWIKTYMQVDAAEKKYRAKSGRIVRANTKTEKAALEEALWAAADPASVPIFNAIKTVATQRWAIDPRLQGQYNTFEEYLNDLRGSDELIRIINTFADYTLRSTNQRLADAAGVDTE